MRNYYNLEICVDFAEKGLRNSTYIIQKLPSQIFSKINRVFFIPSYNREVPDYLKIYVRVKFIYIRPLKLFVILLYP